MKKVLKGILKLLLVLVLIAVIGVGGLLGWLSYTEYQPEDVEQLAFFATTVEADALPADETIDLLSWNIGYGALGDNADFFMDGGDSVMTASKARVEENMSNILTTVQDIDADIMLFQEVDQKSYRSHWVNESSYLLDGLSTVDSTFAYNYRCLFIPYPFPPIGTVNAGILTASVYEISEATRYQLPSPYSWPESVGNLKRCLAVNRISLADSDKELVIVNLHLEAYDDGEGKIAQTKMLREILNAELEKGNYVIAGGDFNQVFPGSLEVYPNTHSDLWQVGILEESSLPEGFSFVYDLSTPTCRLLNQPYDPADTENTQYYVIDGFVVSPNVTVREVQVLNLAFACSDHNPVRLQVCLGEAGAE